MQPERDGRVQRYPLYLWTLDEQLRRGGRPGGDGQVESWLMEWTAHIAQSECEISSSLYCV